MRAAAAKKEVKTGVVYDESMLMHRSHQYFHPERPERVMAVYLNLVKKDLFGKMITIQPDMAKDEDLLLCHS